MNILVGYTDKLNGEIIIHGSKNAALPIISSCLLFNKKITLSNVSNIIDIEELHKILELLNIRIVKENDKYTYIKEENIKNNLLFDSVAKIRASYYLWPCILSSENSLKSFFPGGCNFQERPLDLHFKLFRKFGFNVTINNNIIEFKKLSKTKKYLNIHLEKKSFGVTVNAILLSVKSNKIVKIYNYSKEPEILDLINFLNNAGTKIFIKKTHLLIIGVKKLKETNYEIMQDRIEAGSYILMTLNYPNSVIKMKYKPYEYLKNVIETFEAAGGKFSFKNDYMIFESPNCIKGINLTCDTYPNFPTDLQQILCSSLLNTNSVITDLVYPNRVSHISELKKLNADINFIDNKIHIKPSVLKNNSLNGIDLRGNFSLIVASGKIKENTIIYNIDNLLRGYYDVFCNFRKIGLKIEII